MTTPTLLTTAQAAALLGVTPAWIRRLADRHGVGQRPGHDRLFSAADVETLRGRAPVGWVPGRSRRRPAATAE